MNDDIVIFLDMDGVLNRHEWCHLGFVPRINQDNLKVLAKILQRFKCKVVISSTWGRHIKEFGCGGFQWMFKTHGIDVTVIGGFDGSHNEQERSKQIIDYVKNNGIEKFVVIDDMDLIVPNHIKPHPGIGLEPRHATEFAKITVQWQKV